jgi:glycerol kinase
VNSGLILAIDQGTTNTKALLMDRDGRAIHQASRPVAIRFPQPGWVEQDARELWHSVAEAAGTCLERAGGVTPIAIGISNQRESVLVWDRRSGEPLGPCITWQCRRTSEFCARLRAEGRASFLAERTGLPIDPLFSASKARWLLDQTPHGSKRAADGELAVGTVDSWLLWNLTGGARHACDYTNASRTQLFNIHQLAWNAELLDLFGIPCASLPQPLPSSSIFGETAAGLTHLPAGVPIAAMAGDSHAALFGHAIFTPGAVKATYGTGSSLMCVTESPVLSAHGIAATVAWSAVGQTRYALEGNIAATGAAVDWLGEFLGLEARAEDVAKLAESVPDSAGVYLVPAFAGLGAPHWNDRARGVLTGLTRGATAAHAARAAIECIAYQVRDVFDAMERDAGAGLPQLLADGGATRNDLLMQFQADILGRPVAASAAAEVSALGAAWLAGLTAGVWKSLDELRALPRGERRFEPVMASARREELYAGWREAVTRAAS